MTTEKQHPASSKFPSWWPFVSQYILTTLLLVTVPVFAILLTLFPLPSGISSFRLEMLFGNRVSWTFVAAASAWGLLSLKVPSEVHHGPPAVDSDIRPRYSANGVAFYFVSVATFLALNAWNPAISVLIYDNMPQILCSCTATAMLFCAYLLWKGRNYPEHGKRKRENLPVVFQYYWGTELHPRIFDVDVKQLTNCRIGLLMWQILILAFMITAFQRTGFNGGMLVNVLLQTYYLAMFYPWETCYFNTLDITLDRAGFYICYGCLAFVPSVYTFSTYYFVSHPPDSRSIPNALIFVLAFLAIYLKCQADFQKERFKQSNGTCLIWGEPAVFIPTEYHIPGGVRKSKLLASGYWGIARHLNYTLELSLAFLWNLPGWGLGLAPFLYNVVLAILLIHRIYRDEDKCESKYGTAWKEYCKRVSYRLIPAIY